jgi:hypothetical protein
MFPVITPGQSFSAAPDSGMVGASQSVFSDMRRRVHMVKVHPQLSFLLAE